MEDLRQARNGLDNVRLALEAELRSPLASITDRGMEVLLKKREEAIEELDRLNGFLHSIGRRWGRCILFKARLVRPSFMAATGGRKGTDDVAAHRSRQVD
ncbi:polymorphic toxin type 28 domain-containing protein [Streptomyces sp. NPDC002888]|uniref:polymorphic toxin type 28 domain-containing protein n=1 Tax=Streptomyces sp. NPDC002888 TaxID=3364668 RepID=UPI0036A978A5